MKRLLLLFVLSICFINLYAQNPDVWTPKYEQGVYQQYYAISKNQIHEEYYRKKFCQCAVDTIKKLLPNGLESVSDEKLKEISVYAASTCRSKFLGQLVFTKWTLEIESQLRDFWMGLFSDGEIPLTIRREICDCLIKKYKEKYPNGIDWRKMTNEKAKPINTECLNEITKKHNN